MMRGCRIRVSKRKEVQKMIDILNKQIDLIFRYLGGKITDEEFENNKLFPIPKEVDEEMQQDRFY